MQDKRAANSTEKHDGRETSGSDAWHVVCAAMCVAVVFVYLYGLGALPLTGPDEPRYAQVAREMWGRGDWVTPTLGGFTWFEKPALPYWTMRVGFALFGVNEYAARFGSGVAGLCTVAAAWRIGRCVERISAAKWRGLGVMCAGVTASCLGLLVFARAASFDIYITAATACALWCFFAADIEANHVRRRWFIAGCYAFMGAALLAKGLIGVVLPAGIVGLYFVLRRRVPEGFWWRSLVWGLPLTIAVASLWYVPVITRHGWTFVNEFFIQHHFARYVSNKYRHPQPFYFYLPVVFALALPWSLVLIKATLEAVKAAWQGEGKGAMTGGDATQDEATAGDEIVGRLNLFALAWLVVPVAFFSMSGSKLPGYVLPALPGACLLVGARLVRMRGHGDVWLTATGCLVSLAAVCGAAVGLRMQVISFPSALILGLAGFACGAVAAWSSRATGRAAGLIIAATLASIVIIAGGMDGRATGKFSLRDQLALAAQRGYADAPLYGLHTIDRTAEFYHAGRIMYDAEGEPRKLETLENVIDTMRDVEGRRVLIATNREGVKQLEQVSEFTIEVIGENDDVTLIGVRKN